MEILRVENLKFSYDNQIDILKGVDFALNKGEFVCLIGANGSGKSTIAKLILGLLEAKEGTIYIDGQQLSIETLSLIRDKVGIVFQNPDNQFIGSTVEDDIAFGLENHQVNSTAMPEIISHYAKEVKMEEFLKFEPSRLSGGQKQRVAIAGILAMKPQLIIFDEATSMLDSKGKKEILDIIYDLHQNDDKTILSITHDMEEITRSDRVLVLDQGRIVFFDSPRKLLKEEVLLRKAKLRLPFAADFALKYKNQGGKLQVPLTMNELVEGICQSLSQR